MSEQMPISPPPSGVEPEGSHTQALPHNSPALYKVVVLIAAALAIAGGVVGLMGALTGDANLSSLGFTAPPLHPLALLLFVLFGGYLAASVRDSVSRTRLLTFGVIMKGLCASAIVAQLFGLTLTLPFTPVATGGALSSLDPNAANLTLTFAFGCSALAVLLRNGRTPAVRGWMIIPLVPVFWASYLSLTAHFYQIENLNGYFIYTLVPLPAAILFSILLVGLLASQPREGFMAALSRRYMGGIVARIAFPVILLTPFTVGWIRIRALRSGTYDLAAAFSQFATTNIVIFGAFIWLCAHMLNRVDARRQKVMDSLQVTNSELSRVNTALEGKVAEQERTEEARKRTELQLFQSQKMEAMGTLATGIAHDFNNMLTVIQLNAENAHEMALTVAPDSTDLHRSLQDIRKSGLRAADVVRQIMTFGRKTPGDKHPFDACDAVSEAGTMLRHTIPDSVTLTVDIPSHPLPVFADPTMMQQVLVNLGTNAAHAMVVTGGTLRIMADHHVIKPEDTLSVNPENGFDPAPGRYVRIRVSDTGHGMNEETRTKIFDPFFTTKPPGKGTGLGLSVALGIMRQHGGSITVESTPDRGTTFDVYFPAPVTA
jgi:signal transduction histidine kinase